MAGFYYTFENKKSLLVNMAININNNINKLINKKKQIISEFSKE